MEGYLKNFNTIEEFKQADKQALFHATVHSVRAIPISFLKPTSPNSISPFNGKQIQQSTEQAQPALSPFLLLTFSDLKKFKFYYWFAFPGIVQNPVWEVKDQGWAPADVHMVSDLVKQISPVVSWLTD